MWGSYSTRVDPAAVSAPPSQRSQPVITASKVPALPRTNPIALSGQASAAGFGSESQFSGKLSLGMIASIVVGLVLLYMWTRNVQGGG
jgi:hypothetical protein